MPTGHHIPTLPRPKVAASPRRLVATAAGAAAAVLLANVPAIRAAETVDPHAVYEKRCGGCHFEHGADLARQKMTVKNAALVVTRTGKPVDGILKSHHGVKLTAAELSALTGLFSLGIETGGIFQRRCASCHKTGAAFARESLEIKDGRLMARKSGAEVRAFLATHGGADPAEIDKLARMLQYQIETGPASKQQQGSKP